MTTVMLQNILVLSDGWRKLDYTCHTLDQIQTWIVHQTFSARSLVRDLVHLTRAQNCCKWSCTSCCCSNKKNMTTTVFSSSRILQIKKTTYTFIFNYQTNTAAVWLQVMVWANNYKLLQESSYRAAAMQGAHFVLHEIARNYFADHTRDYIL